MIRILNVEPDGYSEQARIILRSIGTLTEQNMTRTELIAEVGSYEVLIVRLNHKVDLEVLDAASSLRVIVTATTGLDHIDLACAAKKDIVVLSLRGELEFLRSIPATAEHTWGLLLGLVRNIPAAFADVQNGYWRRDRFKGHDLKNQRLGIVGLGRIGEKIAAYGQVFGMQVGAYDPFRSEWLPNVKKYDILTALASESDILSIHVPFVPETENIINSVVLDCMPQGAYFINTARGGVLDEKALLKVLVSGHIAGAALDVLSNEQDFVKEMLSPLLDYARTHRNLIITPHIGGATHESMHATEIFMAQKLKTHLKA